MSELQVSDRSPVEAPPERRTAEGRTPEGRTPERRTAGIEVPRVLGRLEGRKPGPTLILVAGLHGNEPAGVLALQRLFATLAADPRGLDRGRAVALAGNLKALAARRRYLVHDLNRYWDRARVARLRRSAEPLTDEDEELRDLDREIERARRAADGTVYLLDLHTTSGPRLPFATLDDNLPNRELALEFPVPVVLGLEEELADTLTTYVETLGMVTAGFEAGQHDDPESIERAEAAIWIALEACHLVRRGSREEAARARRDLARAAGSLPHVVEVRHRHPVSTGDWFRMDPGWANFQPVARGQSLAVDRNGPITAPFDGMMLMPLYQDQGADGFFVVQRVRPFWLRLSAAVRHLRVDRLLPLLPGVERDLRHADAFVVDRHTARWLARQLFHLLGYRRLGPSGERYLTMARRSYDPSVEG